MAINATLPLDTTRGYLVVTYLLLSLLLSIYNTLFTSHFEQNFKFLPTYSESWPNCAEFWKVTGQSLLLCTFVLYFRYFAEVGNDGHIKAVGS